MTITSELTSMENNVTSIYNKLEEKGATIPANKNLVNIPDTIDTISNEPDYTAMGNELRKANAYTWVEDFNNTCILFDTYTGKFSENFEANNVKVRHYDTMNNDSHGTSYTNCNIIADGKLYKVTSNSSSIVMTQQGTNDGWEDTNGAYYVRNGKIYSSYSNADAETSPRADAINFSPIGSCYSQSCYINDNKAYFGNTQKYTTYNKIDLFMIRHTLDNRHGHIINNGYLYKCKNSENTGSLIFNLQIPNKKIWWTSTSRIHFFVDKTFYAYNSDYSNNTASLSGSYTFTSQILDFFYIYVLLANGNLYYIGSISNPVLILENCKQFLNNWTGHTTFGPEKVHVITNDNKIYRLNSGSTPTLVRTFSVNMQVLNTNISEYISCLKFMESETVDHDLYTIQYNNDITKAYSSNNYISATSYNVISKTNESITVGEHTYNRNTSKDTVFNFIPEDLENHTFSDADLLQAYINAGI